MALPSQTGVYLERVQAARGGRGVREGVAGGAEPSAGGAEADSSEVSARECPRCGEGDWYRQVVVVDGRWEERAVCRPCGALIAVLSEGPEVQVFVHG